MPTYIFGSVYSRIILHGFIVINNRYLVSDDQWKNNLLSLVKLISSKAWQSRIIAHKKSRGNGEMIVPRNDDDQEDHECEFYLCFICLSKKDVDSFWYANKLIVLSSDNIDGFYRMSILKFLRLVKFVRKIFLWRN